MNDEEDSQSDSPRMSAWKLIRLICLGVVATSVLSCVVIAASRSKGLTAVTVFVLDPDDEPQDHDLPFIKAHDALPDYELVAYRSSGATTSLGTKPNTSAAEGLTWTLNEPLPVCEVVGIRLQDQDKLISDSITEVQVVSEFAESDGYRFEFRTEHSVSVGVQSFFRTPIGMAISAAFFIAILLMLASAI